MKKLVVIYQTLKALLIIGNEAFKTLTVQLFSIEIGFGGGYVLVTQLNPLSTPKDKASKKSRFNINSLAMQSLVGNATDTQPKDVTPSMVRDFMRSINANADLTKQELELTYHDVVKDHEIVIDATNAPLLPGTKIGDKVSVTEGYQDRKTAEMIAFASDTKINVYRVKASGAAMADYDAKRASITVALELALQARTLDAADAARKLNQRSGSSATIVAPVANMQTTDELIADTLIGSSETADAEASDKPPVEVEVK